MIPVLWREIVIFTSLTLTPFLFLSILCRWEAGSAALNIATLRYSCMCVYKTGFTEVAAIYVYNYNHLLKHDSMLGSVNVIHTHPMHTHSNEKQNWDIVVRLVNWYCYAECAMEKLNTKATTTKHEQRRPNTNKYAINTTQTKTKPDDEPVLFRDGKERGERERARTRTNFDYEFSNRIVDERTNNYVLRLHCRDEILLFRNASMATDTNTCENHHRHRHRRSGMWVISTAFPRSATNESERENNPHSVVRLDAVHIFLHVIVVSMVSQWSKNELVRSVCWQRPYISAPPLIEIASIFIHSSFSDFYVFLQLAGKFPSRDKGTARFSIFRVENSLGARLAQKLCARQNNQIPGNGSAIAYVLTCLAKMWVLNSPRRVECI